MVCAIFLFLKAGSRKQKEFVLENENKGANIFHWLWGAYIGKQGWEDTDDRQNKTNRSWNDRSMFV